MSTESQPTKEKKTQEEIDNEGRMEMQLRVLGNELIAIKMYVDDFKMKWLIIGIGGILAVAWAAGNFGPALINMFGE